MATIGKLIPEELVELRRLVKGSDSIELKLTIPRTEVRKATRALGFDALEAQIRQVFFFDTPDLVLNRAGVVVRARRIQGREHDSVVKLRPVVPADLPEDLRKTPGFVVEVDALPGGFVCSAALKSSLDQSAILRAVQGEHPQRKLFSKAQRAFFAEHAPDDLTIDDLSVLGPIFVLKLKTMPVTFSRKLVGELWLYPDGGTVVELSTKCLPGEGLDTAIELGELLTGAGIDTGAEQQTKTKTALEFFAAELTAGSEGG